MSIHRDDGDDRAGDRGSGQGAELDGRHLRVGFHSVELDTTPDGAGASFAFVVNGRRLFAKGADWIPDDPFPSRVDADRLKRRLRQAADAGLRGQSSSVRPNRPTGSTSRLR